jgi:PAS domain S-box-containing protein
MKKSANIEMFYFFLKIVLPTLLSIILFAVSVFLVIIPSFENKIMDDKKEMLHELTDTAWSILEESEEMYKKGEISLKEAKERAILRVKDLRYGYKRKDYFWIIDMHPRMIAHPYKPELVGKDLSNYKDQSNKKLFLDSVNLVKQKGSGFISYMWQWMDKPGRVEHKLSYVKGFKPWGWIVGTGIYLEDVDQEIFSMRKNIVAISLGIMAFVSLLLFFAAHQSLKIERKKEIAEDNLRESREKYKALVEASTQGLIMFLEGVFFHSNQAFMTMMGYTASELHKLNFSEIESGGENYFESLLSGLDVPEQCEAKLKRKDGSLFDAILSSSIISFAGKKGFIIIVKDVSGQKLIEQKKLEEERENLITELQTALLFLHQPLKSCLSEIVSCKQSTNVREAAGIMKNQNRRSLLVESENGGFVGIATQKDISDLVAEGGNIERPVSEIMSSPLIAITEQSLVFEAAIQMQENGISHIAVKNKEDKIISVIGNNELLQVQRYSPASMLHEIGKAETAEEIIAMRGKIPLLIKALIDCGVDAKNITKTNSGISDLIHKKLIGFAIKELGTPPAQFCFMAMGSEGRMEETLLTDQDNAIVYEDVSLEDQEKTEKYFKELSGMVCGWLEKTGYKKCEGNIMATNPEWRGSLTKWKKHFSEWISAASPQDLLEFNIFFDFRSVYGNRQLTSSIREHIDELLAVNPSFFLHLAQNCLLYNPPVGMFGKISVKTKGEHAEKFSIKEAMKPVINFARIYCLKNNIEITNTLFRLDRLFEKEVISESTHREAIQVYNFLMRLRFSHQALLIEKGKEPDNYINPKELSGIERDILKKVFSQIAAFQSKLSFDFKGAA